MQLLLLLQFKHLLVFFLLLIEVELSQSSLEFFVNDDFKLVKIETLWRNKLVYFHVEMWEKLIFLSQEDKLLVLDFELLDSVDLAKLGFIDLLLFDGLYRVFILASQDVVEHRFKGIFISFLVVLYLPFGYF